jgi:hypothetical protein
MTDKKSNEVAVITTSPMTLMELAITKGADIVTIEKLMALKERWDAQEAKKAFLKALSEFQAVCPVMKKTKLVSFKTQKGQTRYNYAPLGGIVKQISPLLKKFGLSYRWKTAESSDKIKLECIVSHVDGHSESNPMEATKDDSGSKNLIQQVGSTITYLQRYSLIGALGIATADDDNDVQHIAPPKAKEQIKISKAKSTELLDKSKILIDEYTDQKDLKAKYKSFVQEQFVSGMHEVDIKELKRYINAKNVSLKKAGQTKTVDLP